MDTLLGLYVANKGKLPMEVQETEFCNKVFTIVEDSLLYVKQRFRFVTDTGEAWWGDQPVFTPYRPGGSK